MDSELYLWWTDFLLPSHAVRWPWLSFLSLFFFFFIFIIIIIIINIIIIIIIVCECQYTYVLGVLEEVCTLSAF